MVNQQRNRDHVLAIVQRTAPIVNGALLFACLAYLFCFDAARVTISHFEKTVSTRASSEGNRLWPYVFIAMFGVTFVTMMIGLWRGRRESRSVRAWFLLMFLVCGWLAIWLGRHDLYWYGHASRVSQEVSAAEHLAKALDRNWPAGDGDYPELGVVLGYPKAKPVTYILAGRPKQVGKLRIVAFDKSEDDETLRFQLAHPNHDTWLVRKVNKSGLGKFADAFVTNYTANRVRQLSKNWFLVRYESSSKANPNAPAVSRVR